MEFTDNLQIVCPIRGQLTVKKRSKDGLSPLEEFYRVEAIKYLISKGYPKDNFWIEPIIKHFGNGGKNSFRSDFAVLDVPASIVEKNDPDLILAHALLICEVKRDNAKREYVKYTQVKPMLDFAKRQDTLGLYWDNIERRVFWMEYIDGVKEFKEGPLSFIPKFGFQIQTNPLTFATIEPTDSLIDIFDRIANVLHQASFAPEARYEIILQLLLAKIFDEHAYESRPDLPLEIQDYKSLGTSPEITQKKVSSVIKRAISFYGKHLPNKISDKLPLSADNLYDILQILAPVKIIHSKRDVIQTFYMKFAKDLYKWDMAQYFTPTTVTDFLVDIINPQFGEHIADPACGSADFLVAAFRIARQYNPGYADCIWGIDNSSNAVQVAVLNMLLNGDGKTNIIKDDSLENVGNYIDKYDVITCNPPFGTKIVETRPRVLRKYELGYAWEMPNDGVSKKTDVLLDRQETGILFVELCVRICKPNGRIAIILPNGYLGNRSPKYKIVREWILRHTKIAAVISLPRFTFKSSGADVSASILYLEKREKCLARASDDKSYRLAVEMIEKVGWNAGDKQAKITYKRNNLTIDPKRYSKKVMTLRCELLAQHHCKLGDIVDFIPERTTSAGQKVHVGKSVVYQYVEIQNIGHGDYHSDELMGWELPSRAKHFAESGDIFFGAIWGSATKWFVTPRNIQNVVVTNGCFRCRMKPGKNIFLPDLIAYFNSEGWAVQMRALARGSDGLAEICEDDVRGVIIPCLSDKNRELFAPYLASLIEGSMTISAKVKQMIRGNQIYSNDPPKRPSHIVLV